MDKVVAVIYTLICVLFAFSVAVIYKDLLKNDKDASETEDFNYFSPSYNGIPLFEEYYMGPSSSVTPPFDGQDQVYAIAPSPDVPQFEEQYHQYNFGPSPEAVPLFEEQYQGCNIGPSSDAVPQFEERYQEYNIGPPSTTSVSPRSEEQSEGAEEIEELETNYNNCQVAEAVGAPQPEPQTSEDYRRSFGVPEEPNDISELPVEYYFVPLTAVIGFLPVNRHFLRHHQLRFRQFKRPYGNDVVVMSGGDLRFDPVFRGGEQRIPHRWTGSNHVDQFGPNDDQYNSYDLNEEVVADNEIIKADDQNVTENEQEQAEPVLENNESTTGFVKSFRKFLNHASELLNIYNK